MINYQKLTGLVAAPHTAMHADCSLNLDCIPQQAAALTKSGVTGAFICGTTGEGTSLSVAERKSVAEKWISCREETGLSIVVHVGALSIEDAKELSRHAESLKADAISSMAPSFIKPSSPEELANFFVPIASTAPSTPFYFYHIPSLTAVHLSVAEFLRVGAPQMNNLVGIKFTHSDQFDLQRCLAADDGAFDILWGIDECLLSGLALGCKGAVGSTYNYAAPLYLKLMEAFEAGDLETARQFAQKSVAVVTLLLKFGVPPSGKALVQLHDIDLGPVRPPLINISEAEKKALLEEVRALQLPI